jgi:hypothetical protein
MAAELARLAHAGEAEEVVRSRVRQAWLGRQAAEDLAWDELAMGWAERGTEVVLITTAGRHRGRLTGVGRDFVVMVVEKPRRSPDATPPAHPVLVATTAIRQVLPPPGEAQPGPGHGAPGEPMAMADALQDLAATRTQVELVAPPCQPLEGELRWVGRDLACLLTGPHRRPVYVPLAAISELTVLAHP